jgi:Tol biopolymer transport system component
VTADAAEPPAAAGPDARPASVTDAVEGTTLVDTPDYFPGALATVGGASFQAADDAAPDGRIVPAGAADGGAVLRITRIVNDEASNFHIRPSPDGTRIAFDSNRDGTRGVYVADGDGSNVRRVSGEGFAAVPSWSPDGRRLVYVRADVERPRVWNLWTLDLASGEERQLTSNATGQPWGASWFPDGRRLAYNHGARLVVLDIESGRQRTYPAPGRGELVRTPSVSPDGRRVIFQVERDGAWLLDVGDGSMRKVLSDPTAEDYIWSPDGRRVAYHSRRSGEWGVWQVLSH